MRSIFYQEAYHNGEIWHQITFRWRLPHKNKVGGSYLSWRDEIHKLNNIMDTDLSNIRAWTYGNVPTDEFDNCDHSGDNLFIIYFRHKHHAMLCKLELT